ncbi:MAG: uroporphyrinogen-III synthase [Acidobacteriota bacterium]
MSSPPKPLQGRTILITRSRSQSAGFRELLESAGARVLEVPAIEIRPRMSRQLDDAILQLESYDWLFVTSANAAAIFAGQVTHLRPRLRPDSLERPRVCAIGPATSEKIQESGYRVALVPAVFQAEGVIDEFVKFHQGNLAGVRILLPRAAQAREILPEELRRRGAIVDLIPVYDTAIPDGMAENLRELLQHAQIDLITFTSSSTVHHFVQAAGLELDVRRFRYAAIGPITAATAQEYSLPIAVQPVRWTVPDLVRAIIEYFNPAE